MKLLLVVFLQAALLTVPLSAQNNFAVTGTPIPDGLLQQNYGKVPKGIGGYDVNICNVSSVKQPLVSGDIYQALAQSNPGLQPIGRQIMLASILRNQNHSKGTILTITLNSITGVLSVLSSSKLSPPSGVVTGAALGAISAQLILNSFKPMLTTDQVEKFESESLEPALVLDAGSCVERTIFAAVAPAAAKTRSLAFHVR